MRIAFARIAQETNSLSPVLTEVADFERTHFYAGRELLDRCASRFRREAPGMAFNAELSGMVQEATRLGAECVPLFSAWAIPGGPLSDAAISEFESRLARDLRAAGPIDGLMLSLHGAMGAVGRTDPEADLLRVAREVVGPRVKIGVSYDLHGHLTAEKVDRCDVLAAYLTNPHRDHASTGRRVANVLVRAIRGEVAPVAAWRSLPMVLGGGANLDFAPPMRGLYRRIAAIVKQRGVLDASLFQCHIWNDAAHAGWGVYVLADRDRDLAERLADELADACWAVRHQLPPEFPDAEEAIRQARAARLARRFGVVCVSDASDMVGAGAVGENTALLAALLTDARDLVSFAPVRDADAIARLWNEPVGHTVELDVGGRLAPRFYQPIHVRGVLVEKRESTQFGRAALLDLGHVKLVVTEAAPLAMKPAFYTDWGLRMRDADIVVVKSLFPFRWYFLAQNRKTIYARTRGVTDFDVFRSTTYDRPVHPKDALDDWREHARTSHRG